MPVIDEQENSTELEDSTRPRRRQADEPTRKAQRSYNQNPPRNKLNGPGRDSSKLSDKLPPSQNHEARFGPALDKGWQNHQATLGQNRQNQAQGSRQEKPDTFAAAQAHTRQSKPGASDRTAGGPESAAFQKPSITAPQTTAASAKQRSAAPGGNASVPGTGVSAATMRDAAGSLRHGQRPSAKAILDLAQNIPAIAPELRIIRLGLKFLREDEEEVAEAIWPKNSLTPNPQKAKLAGIVARIIFKLILIGVGSVLVTWALVFGTIILLFLTMACNTAAGSRILAGYFNQGTLSKAGGAITGNAAICESFTVKNFPTVNLASTNAFGGGGASNTWGISSAGNGSCQTLTSGPASVTNLSTTCFGANAAAASEIAGAESGGQATAQSSTDKCADGNSVSIGLFQINLTNHQIAGLNCPSAFSSQFTASNHSCVVTNPSLYQQCLAAAEDPNSNIQEACTISNNGASWNQWGSHSRCGL